MTVDSQPDIDRRLKVVEGERSSVRGTRFGSNSVFRVFPLHVRLAAESGIPRAASQCRSCATTGKSSRHSITSSAVNRSFGGMVKPSAFAVFKLITRSYLVGC
jgi:hypothetical protein